ncbi:hypothetical protein [Streptomyces sp. NPDC051001]|uniref:hypothetical protein n=1 Tax=Streptomyces sp. NPDC051001 TaxID=3155795 RepID=UPI00341CA76C
MRPLISATHQGILLAWATEFSFLELKNTLADLSSHHANPPTSLSIVPFRSSSTQGVAAYPTSAQGINDLMDKVTSVSLILSKERNRGADVSQLASLAADRHIGIEVFYPIGSHKSIAKFAAKLAKSAKGGCVPQEFKSNELPVLLKTWVERQVEQSEGSAERIAQSYSGNHWMDALGGFQ